MWKDMERVAARRLNGRRVGPSGTSTADVVNERLAVECKSRKSLPKLITEAMAQAVRAAAPGQTPLVILHEKGKRHNDDIVCMRLIDYQDWYGQIDIAEER